MSPVDPWQVRAFWHELEVSANGHQEVLLGRLNTHLAEITQEIEAVVGEALAIELQPVAISLPLPSAQDFHETLAELFAQGALPRVSHPSICVHLLCYSHITIKICFYKVLCHESPCAAQIQ